MTLSKTGTNLLTQDEWNEMVALKNAINENPASGNSEKMEIFTELLVRSLVGKGNPSPPKNWRGTALSE